MRVADVVSILQPSVVRRGNAMIAGESGTRTGCSRPVSKVSLEASDI
jgi:hypothetical protein